MVQSSLEEQILPEKSVAEDFYSVSLFCLFHYCSLCSLPLDFNSDMSFRLRLSHPLPHLLDFWKNGMDFFFFLTYALRKYIVLKHQPILLIFWWFGTHRILPAFVEKSALNSDIFILVLVFLTTPKMFQLGLLYHLMDNHYSQSCQIVTSLTCYVFGNFLLVLVWSAPLLKSSPQHKLEKSNITRNQHNIHRVRCSHEHLKKKKKKAHPGSWYGDL